MESPLVSEKMMKMSKILININNLSDIEEYKKIGISNFLFAIEDFSIGYKTFKLDEIPESSYILINRVLDCNDVDNIKKIKDDLLRFKGIIYEDVAIYNIFKDENIELIWNQNHFATNYESINYYLNHGCSSAIISNELTEDEIIEILDKASKPLVLNILGRNQVMYSRRKLLSNFNKHNNLSDYNDMTLDTFGNMQNFFAHESKYGTILTSDNYFNYVSLMNKVKEESIYYYLILNQDLSAKSIKEILDGAPYGNDGFLNKKTVYRMSEYDDRKN